MRKQVQEKLIKFATRVPMFMYLTDYRERSLKDVITQLEPGLFKKVTGLDVKDFELLVSLNVFNGSLMNDAIFKFKRYEDSSLSYTGIDKHAGEDVGGWDTVVKRSEYEALCCNHELATLLFLCPSFPPWERPGLSQKNPSKPKAQEAGPGRLQHQSQIPPPVCQKTEKPAPALHPRLSAHPNQKASPPPLPGFSHRLFRHTIPHRPRTGQKSGQAERGHIQRCRRRDNPAQIIRAR